MRRNPDEPLSPACMKCEQVTGNATCFPAPCVFYHERNVPGTKAYNVAALDRIRRGSLDPIYAPTSPRRTLMNDVVERVARECSPSREELIANLEYATKLLRAWPILNATAQVQHLCSVVARARPAALADASPDIGKEGIGNE